MSAGREGPSARALRGMLLALLGMLLIGAAWAQAAGPTRSSKVPRSFFGINAVPAPTPADAAAMASGGISRARIMLRWDYIQPGSTGGGAYNWAYPDAEVASLAQSGIEAVPVLLGTPPWLTPSPMTPPTTTKQRPAWRAFVRAARRRYGPHGEFWQKNPELPYRPAKYWQVWNEPNFPTYWAPSTSPGQYARLLRLSARTIRSAAPGLKVVLAGIGPASSGTGGKISSSVFLNRLYQKGAKRFFDVAAEQPYGTGVKGVAQQLKRGAAVIRRHKDRQKPVWITEVGWASTHIAGRRWAVGSQKKQASLLKRTFRYVIGHRQALGVRAIYWYDWKDIPDHYNGHGWNFGLRSDDGAPKPAWNAFLHFSGKSG